MESVFVLFYSKFLFRISLTIIKCITRILVQRKNFSCVSFIQLLNRLFQTTRSALGFVISKVKMSALYYDLFRLLIWMMFSISLFSYVQGFPKIPVHYALKSVWLSAILTPLTFRQIVCISCPKMAGASTRPCPAEP